MIISSLVISRYVIDVLNIVGGALGVLGGVYMAVDLLNLRQKFQKLTLVLLEIPLLLMLPVMLFYESFIRKLYAENVHPFVFIVGVVSLVLYTASVNSRLWISKDFVSRHWSWFAITLPIGGAVIFVIILIIEYITGFLSYNITHMGTGDWVFSFVFGIIGTAYSIAVISLTKRVNQFSSKTLAIIGVVLIASGALMLMASPIADLLGIQVS